MPRLYYVPDKAEDIPPEEISSGGSEQLALHLRGITSPKGAGRKAGRNITTILIL